MRTIIAAHELLPKELSLECLSIETGCVVASVSGGSSSGIGSADRGGPRSASTSC